MPDPTCTESIIGHVCTLPQGHAGMHQSVANLRWHTPAKVRELLQQQRPAKEPTP